MILDKDLFPETATNRQDLNIFQTNGDKKRITKRVFYLTLYKTWLNLFRVLFHVYYGKIPNLRFA